MNLLELRTKRMLVCIKYIGAMDQGLVPTLGFLTLRVLTHLVTVLVAKRDSAYTERRVSERIVTLIHSVTFGQAINLEHVCFMS